MQPWFENEELWEQSRSCMFPQASFRAGPAEVAACLGLSGQRGPLDVLDLPCGPGRHALPLARLGHRVVAVDRTEAYVEELRREVEAFSERSGRTLAIEAETADMRDFVRPNSFDLLLNLFHSFGFFRDAADDQRVLANFHRCLRPGGVLIQQLQAEETLLPLVQPRQEADLSDGRRLIQERCVQDGGRWMQVTWTFEAEGERKSFDLSHRIYSGSELRQGLEAAGFSTVQLFGNLKGEPYGAEATSLVAVAQR